MSDMLLVESILYERKVGEMKDTFIIKSYFITSFSYKPWQGVIKLCIPIWNVYLLQNMRQVVVIRTRSNFYIWLWLS